jgi:rare lipoprotein A (peptidoglycan hydrolase)
VSLRRSALVSACAASALLACALSIVDCAPKRPPGPSPDPPRPPQVTPPVTPPASPPRSVEEGVASWYGPGFDGRETANGEVYDQDAMTAAHPSLPFGTRVRVTRVATGRHVVVRINDRGPWFEDRVIDLSRAAGAALGLMKPGIAAVRLEIVGRGPRRSAPAFDRVVE